MISTFSFYIKGTGGKTQGKHVVTQGKPGDNTGNFVSIRMWPPCSSDKFQKLESCIERKIKNLCYRTPMNLR